MLRQYSSRRVLAFCLWDWLGSAGLLVAAAVLRARLGDLPAWLRDLAAALDVTVGGTESAASPVAALPLSLGVLILVLTLWPLVFLSFSVYDGRRSPTVGAELRRVFLATCAATLLLAGALFFTYREASRLLVIIFFVLDTALLLGSRFALWGYRRVTKHRHSLEHRRVVVVGAGPVGRKAVEQLKRCSWAGIDLVGYVDDDPQKQQRVYQDLPVLGILDQLPQIVAANGIGAAVVALPLGAHERIVQVCRMLQDLSVRVHVIPDLFALSFPSATLDGFGGIPVIYLGQPGMHGWRRVSKRAFDCAVALLTLILLSPALVLIGLLIKLESPGPVIFRQQRVGERGQPFTMLKFRSMQVGSNPGAHAAHVKRLIEENLKPQDLSAAGSATLKMDHDPRITRIGRFIRKTSLDELPQLFNVLRGEMSLVGPRPPLPYEVESYKDWHKRRLEALPGMTGWWQVKGRNRVSFDEMVRMDLAYIEKASFWFDLRILLLTPGAVVSARGAG
jgi:exopolysaccharide biosynthesis polyprenyl glycosylphosphotransferase